MIPKIDACLESLEAGVGKVHVIDGRLSHSLLLEMYTHSGIGTEITLERPIVNGHANRSKVLAKS